MAASAPADRPAGAVRQWSLDGDDWQLRGALGLEWRWHVAAPAARAEHWVRARVPGSVVDDLWRAGAVPHPYHERNSLLLEWVPERSWVYRRRLPEVEVGPGERAVLRFAGVDHAATVLVDGVEAGRHQGAFVPFAVDVTEALRAGGEHVLAVVVHPAPDSEPQVGVTAAARPVKSRMGYGWDFCPRLVHQGIWQPVTLEVGPEQPAVTVRSWVRPDLRTGGVVASGEAELELWDGDRLVAAGGDGHLEVDQPRLWWPNGEGPQALYRLAVRTAGGTRWTTVGFKHLELAPNEDAPAGARPYTLVVNGRRLYLKGWNWVPIDPLVGVPRPAKLAHLLDLAAGAHVNLLRVWGGGLLETEAFYDGCDRRGLLVWQEFPLSSSGMDSVPPGDAEYLTALEATARAAVPRLARHPSLALWCGGNELARHGPGDRLVPLDDTTPALGALRAVVEELDPGRPWLPTSPSGPAFANRLEVIAADPDGQHDVHGPWEHQGLADHHRLYDAGTCLLLSEFGAEGMTNRRALEALIDPEHRWPADRGNPVYEHLGAWWNNAPLVQRSFGGGLRDLPSLRRASQLLQADGLRYALEANRRRAWRSSGTIPWQLNESYPNAWCTAAVDYTGEPKPAYYAVKRAYRPVHVCARFDTVAWGGRDQAEAEVWAWGGGTRVRARFVDLWGRTAAESSWAVAAPTDRPRPLGHLRVRLEDLGSDVFFLDLQVRAGAEMTAGNRYLLSRGPDLAAVSALPPADVTVDPAPGALLLRAGDGPAAAGLVVEDARPAGAAGWAVPSDNGFDLLPGESRRIDLACRDLRDGRPVLRVGGWNLPERLVELPATGAQTRVEAGVPGRSDSPDTGSKK